VSPLAGMGKAHYALTAPPQRPDPADDEPWELALRRVDEVIERHGWAVGPNNPARGSLAEALAALYRLGRDDLVALLDRYAVAAAGLAGEDVAAVLAGATLDEVTENVVVWTVLGDRVFSALRRLAQESEAARRAGSP
jgi:hypothetical protein